MCRGECGRQLFFFLSKRMTDEEGQTKSLPSFSSDGRISVCVHTDCQVWPRHVVRPSCEVKIKVIKIKIWIFVPVLWHVFDRSSTATRQRISPEPGHKALSRVACGARLLSRHLYCAIPWWAETLSRIIWHCASTEDEEAGLISKNQTSFWG